MTPPEDRAPSAHPPFLPVWSGELRPAAADVPWLWDGYLAPGNVTMLTSQWKSGKSTLLGVLLARRAAGGTLAGRGLKPGRTAVLSEESREHWEQRRRMLDFGSGVAFFCRPLGGRKPTRDEWARLIDGLARVGAEGGADLAVIDPLAAFLPPGCENNNDLMLAALAALDRLRALGMAALLLHHPKKGTVMEGQAGRGAGGLMGCVDINVEMHPYRAAPDADRRRVLKAGSRFPTTPPQLVIEWNADGTDYLPRGDIADELFREHWEQLASFLASAPGKLTRREVRALWPAGRDSPSDSTVSRWLERAVLQGLLRREGTGHRDEAFRYWLPGREAEWVAEQDPLERIRKADEAMLAEMERTAGPPKQG